MGLPPKEASEGPEGIKAISIGAGRISEWDGKSLLLQMPNVLAIREITVGVSRKCTYPPCRLAHVPSEGVTEAAEDNYDSNATQLWVLHAS